MNHKLNKNSTFAALRKSTVSEALVCRLAFGKDSSPFPDVAQEMHKILPVDSRQFGIDDNKLIRYASQNREHMFGAPYSVHDPTLISKVQYNRIAKMAIIRDNEGGAKVWSRTTGMIVIGG
jgi:hypothetical protein